MLAPWLRRLTLLQESTGHDTVREAGELCLNSSAISLAGPTGLTELMQVTQRACEGAVEA